MENRIGKRSMERFELELPAKLTVCTDADECIDCSTTDICAGGAYFRVDQPFPVGTEVDINIILPLDELKRLEGKRALINVSGIVIRATDNGMAVYFDEDYKITPVPD